MHKLVSIAITYRNNYTQPHVGPSGLGQCIHATKPAASTISRVTSPKRASVRRHNVRSQSGGIDRTGSRTVTPADAQARRTKQTRDKPNTQSDVKVGVERSRRRKLTVLLRMSTSHTACAVSHQAWIRNQQERSAGPHMYFR